MNFLGPTGGAQRSGMAEQEDGVVVPGDVAKEEKYYEQVFEDFAETDADGKRVITGKSVKASLLMLGIDDDQISLRFARFISRGDRTLASIESVLFKEWLELATVYVIPK